MITVGTRVRIRAHVADVIPDDVGRADSDFLTWLRRFEGATGTIAHVSEAGTALIVPDNPDLLSLAFSETHIGWRVEDLTTDLVPALDDRAAVDAWLDA